MALFPGQLSVHCCRRRTNEIKQNVTQLTQKACVDPLLLLWVSRRCDANEWWQIANSVAAAAGATPGKQHIKVARVKLVTPARAAVGPSLLLSC